MKQFTFVALAALLLIFFIGGVDAQKKPTRRPPPPVKIVPPLDVRAGREKVDNQLHNVDVFVNRLGPIAQSIELLDASAKTKNLPKKTIDDNEANKQKVIGAIRNLKAGLTDLESEFRTKSALQKYLPNIQGITELASQSEDLAIAGKFVASKDPLRKAGLKLTDTLKVMPM